jgi:ABC-type uncharacterized transport system ATPase subunit
MNQAVLNIKGITKRFGRLVANDQIWLSLQAGQVLALLGENGAGKSTLVSILFGHYMADEGSIEVFGKPLPPGQPRAALQAGIGMVHQHFTLADNLSVLDNIMLGTEPMWQPFSRRQLGRQRLQSVCAQFGLMADPDARVGHLSVGEKQRVEILKALYRGARILILDEPTAILTPAESLSLFATLRQMVDRGLSIIFISHKLSEVLRVSDQIAVLRAGKLVAQCEAKQTHEAELALWMVGKSVQMPQKRSIAAQGLPVCTLRDVSTEARDGLRSVSLELRAGEILAIAGVSGNGQLALADLLCGMQAATQGQVRLMGRVMKAIAAQWVSAGVARIPEDRHGVGVIGDLPVWENAASERLRGNDFSRGIWIRSAAARQYAQAIIDRFDVRGAGLDSAARALSGGNMQKLILGRALHRPTGSGAPLLIVAHQPTWGLDIGAVAYVQRCLLEARDRGAAIVLISDDLDEVMSLGDRVAVMHGGRLTAALPAEQWSRESIGLAMAGSEVVHAA